MFKLRVCQEFVSPEIDDESVKLLSCKVELFSVNEHGRSDFIENFSFHTVADIRIKPEETGHYYLKISLGGGLGVVETMTAFFVTADDRERTLTRINSAGLDRERVPYFFSPSPQNDFLVATYVGSDLDCDAVDLNMSDSVFGVFNERILQNCEFTTIVYSSTNAGQAGFYGDLIFSGYCWLKDKFVYGQGQLDEESKNELDGYPLGMYTVLKVEDDRVSIRSDYFSFCKIFYYQDESVSVASNNYHLLVSYLRCARVSLSLDFEVVYSQFSSNVTLFLQSFNNKMPVKGTFMLNTWEEIEIDRLGFHVQRNKLYFDLIDCPSLSKNEYAALIERSANDIKENIAKVAKNCSFDNVVLDLSGGRDSRVNYSAITGLKDRSKFKIKSNLHEPDDLSVAIALNNFYKIPYCDKAENISYPGIKMLTEQKRSYNMGYRYLWYIPQAVKSGSTDIRVSGESFEAFSTRYYSNVLSDPFGVESADSLLDEYLKKLSRQPLISFSHCYDQLRESLRYTLDCTPERDPVVAFDNLFLYYRMATHAGNLDRNFYDGACCMPLQSKHLIPAKRWWITKYYHDHIIFDITYKLNPLLSQVPYNNPKTNRMFESAYADLLISDSEFSGVDLCLDNDISSWEESYKRRRDASLVEGSAVSQEEERVFLLEQVTKHAKVLVEDISELTDSLIVPCVYQAFCNTSSDTQRRVIHNKLSSLRDLHVLISGE